MRDTNFDEGSSSSGPPTFPKEVIEAWRKPKRDPNEFQPSGRPTSERLGVDVNMGGRPREEDRTFMSSGELADKALKGMPTALQGYRNTKIERPTSHDVYGQPSSVGGYYQPGSGRVVVGRGNERLAHGQAFAVDVAREELAHKAAFDLPQYASDRGSNWTELRTALQQGMGQYDMDLMKSLGPRYDADDMEHVFTELVSASIRGKRLPPSVRRYLRHLDKPMEGYERDRWQDTWR